MRTNGNAKDCQGVMWWDKVGQQGGEERGRVSWCILAGNEDRTTQGDVQLFAPYLKVLEKARMVPKGNDVLNDNSFSYPSCLCSKLQLVAEIDHTFFPLRYETGDHVGIYAENCDETLEEAATLLGQPVGCTKVRQTDALK
ncbi:NADPH-cytochrome P450 reductase [Tanacetum coccineum]